MLHAEAERARRAHRGERDTRTAHRRPRRAGAHTRICSPIIGTPLASSAASMRAACARAIINQAARIAISPKRAHNLRDSQEAG